MKQRQGVYTYRSGDRVECIDRSTKAGLEPTEAAEAEEQRILDLTEDDGRRAGGAWRSLTAEAEEQRRRRATGRKTVEEREAMEVRYNEAKRIQALSNEGEARLATRAAMQAQYEEAKRLQLATIAAVEEQRIRHLTEAGRRTVRPYCSTQVLRR